MKPPFNTEGTILNHLGIEFKEVTKERAVLTLPVDSRTRTYTGFIHGGAYVTVAEAAAGVGALMNIDRDTQHVVGMEINANHLRAASGGSVTATAIPYHVGRRTSVWEVRLTDEGGSLLCIVRCTIAHMDKKG